ncbi:MAG: hypothetical protein WC951_09205 [Bacteroidales bacterium]
MKRTIYLILAVAAFLAIVSCAGNETQKKANATEVSIDSLIADASAYEGQTVKFTATVDHACTHGGKRLTVFGSIEGKTLKIDGTDNSPSFPASLMGKKVEVFGTVRKVAGSHVEDCEAEEGNEVPEVAYVIDCIDFKEL